MQSLQEKANNIRRRIIDTCYHFKLGHLGSCSSCVEILTALAFDLVKPGDRFLLSKGHASVALYSTWIEEIIERAGGIDSVKLAHNLSLIKDELIHPFKQSEVIFKIIDGRFVMLPNMEELCEHVGKASDFGIYLSTGSLGHSLPQAVGMAIAQPQSNVFVLMSDGEFGEGSNWEALYYAAKMKVSNLIVIIDRNYFQGYQVEDTDDLQFRDRILAAGWSGVVINGHIPEDFKQVFLKRQSVGYVGPFFIIALTKKGYKLGKLENTLESHYVVLDEKAYKELALV